MLLTSFCYSAVLAWQLAKQIEHKEKDKKRKAKREANMAKARRHKSDWEIYLLFCGFYNSRFNIFPSHYFDMLVSRDCIHSSKLFTL